MDEVDKLVRAELPLSEDQLAQRRQMGDRLDVPRVIDHSMFFGSLTQAKAATDEFGALG